MTDASALKLYRLPTLDRVIVERPDGKLLWMAHVAIGEGERNKSDPIANGIVGECYIIEKEDVLVMKGWEVVCDPVQGVSTTEDAVRWTREHPPWTRTRWVIGLTPDPDDEQLQGWDAKDGSPIPLDVQRRIVAAI